MTQHTPGPWAIAGEEHASAIVAKDFVVADVFACKASEAGPRTEQEAEANARLIASAPDLLVALKDARERLEYLEPEYFDDESHEVEWRDYLAKTDDLIAKAEGMR